MKTRIKIRIAGTLFVAAVVVTVYLYVFRTRQPDMARLKTDFYIEATDLYSEFEADEQAATGKFGGKIVEVSGSVETKERNEWGNVTITFIDPFNGVTCTIDSLQELSQPEMIGKVKEGDRITVKGRCDGMLTDVKIVRCVILPGTKNDE